MSTNQRLSADDLGARMRNKRHRLSLTLQQLAESTGVSVGYLSQVERGKATPTLGTLSQIALALGVDVEYFISKPRVADSMTRAAARPRFAVAGSSIQYEQIGASIPGHEFTSFILNVPPRYESELVRHVGEEILYILEGEVTQVVSGREYTLGPGDSLHFLGENPHCWSNKTDQPARILWVGRMEFENMNGNRGDSQKSDSAHADIVPMRPFRGANKSSV